jgi:hypothetical protein
MTSYFHEEQRFGWVVWAIVGLIALPVIAFTAEVAMRDLSRVLPLMGAPIVILLVALLAALARLVTDVDEGGVHVNFHMLWPARHIPFDDIKRAHAMAYNPLSYGGWGVHYMLLRGWSFDAGGGHGVLIETKSGPRIMIGSHRAAELEAAIARAVAERAGRDA